MNPLKTRVLRSLSRVPFDPDTRATNCWSDRRVALYIAIRMPQSSGCGEDRLPLAASRSSRNTATRSAIDSRWLGSCWKNADTSSSPHELSSSSVRSGRSLRRTERRRSERRSDWKTLRRDSQSSESPSRVNGQRWRCILCKQLARSPRSVLSLHVAFGAPPSHRLGLRLPPQKRRDRTLAIVYNRGHEINNQYQREALDP